MKSHLRKTSLFAPLVGGALMASVLVGVSACAVLPFGLGLQPDDENSVPTVLQFAAEKAERMPALHEQDEHDGAVPMPREKPPLLLTVEPGDSVSRIARRYGVAERSIIVVNGLTYPYWLLTGQQLMLPREARKERAPSSLSALARQADVGDVPLPPTRNTFLWPAEGRVISRFGSKPGGMHNDGINIAVPVGSDIRAAQNGVVAYAGNELRGYGNLVLIRHGGGWMTAYAHNEALLVGKGDVVQRGQVISRSGKTGRVSRPQAHFEIRHDGEPQDPLRLLTRK